MDQVHVIRHQVLVEGRSQRRVAREFGISRVTVRKYVEGASGPPSIVPIFHRPCSLRFTSSLASAEGWMNDDRSIRRLNRAVRQPTQPNLGPTVLIIDDHAPTVEAYSTVLRLAGFATTTALTGQNGVELAAMMRIDVALIDLNLPDQRGVDVVRKLRALGCGARMVIVTAFPSFESSFEASSAGADGYVDGPLFGDDVVDLVERARSGPWPVWHPRGTQLAAGDSPSQSASAIDPRVREALRLIDANLARPWSNREVALIVGLSESRWRYLFEACMGTSMVAYIRERRLQEVARRLTSTIEDVRQIANNVGFRSMSLGDFRRAFRERFGVSPREYRSRYWRSGP